MQVKTCPFCGEKPKTYEIGDAQKREKMVMCKTANCALWLKAFQLDVWQKRA